MVCFLVLSSWIKVNALNCENYVNWAPRRIQRSLYVFSDLFSSPLDTASNILIWREELQCYFLVIKIKDAGDRVESWSRMHF